MAQTPRNRLDARINWAYFLPVLLLWAFFAQAVTAMVVQSPTVDEQAYLSRGYIYLKTGDQHFEFGHPVLSDALSALPLATLSHLDLRPDDPAYADNNWPDFSERVIWQKGNNIDLIFFLGRWPNVALTTLLAALVFLWARQLWGRGAGLAALALFAFDPTLVAHSQMITHDASMGVFFFASAFTFWRYLKTGRAREALIVGVALGLAQGTKFAAVLLVPVSMLVVGVWPVASGLPALERARWWRRHAAGLLAIFGIGGLTLWATYHFELRPVSGLALPWPVPGASYFEDVRWEVQYFNATRDFYFCGQYGSGWWYYFPVAFALKSPLSAMLLIAASVIGLLWGDKKWPHLIALVFPAGAYIGATLISPLYIGYRYFIPALPFLYVLAGRLAALVKGRGRFALIGVLIWSALIAVWIHPNDLAYFNELAGGPDNGWRCLTDSNIDWGQGLPALRDVIKRYQLGRVKLSYFGRAFPSYYGIDFEPLPTYYGTPEQGNPLTSPFYPRDPAPGVYAISVTNMRGTGMLPAKWQLYEWFRDKRPFAKAGYSIFLYRVEPRGTPVDVALSGLQVDEIAAKTNAEFGTNDTRLHWFDAHNSLVIPKEPSWYVLDKDNLAAWGWKTTSPCALDDGRVCALYPPDPMAHAAALAYVERMSQAHAWQSSDLSPQLDPLVIARLNLPANVGNQVQFLGYALESRATEADPLSLLTAWRVMALPDGPRSIFAHLLAPDGKLVSQWDGLGVLPEGWRTGDTFIQRVSLSEPKDVVPGNYWIQVGMYNPETMKRLPVIEQSNTIAERILVMAIRLK